MKMEAAQVLLKATWGATEPPFSETTRTWFETPQLTECLQRTEKMIQLGASGVLYGPNGSGKSLLLDTLVERLPEKAFSVVKFSHATLTGPDLIRGLCRSCGIEPAMRRSDNVNLLHRHWQSLGGVHPVVILDEAQDLQGATLEEARLLLAGRAKLTGESRTSAFSLLLCGDQNLLPFLHLGVHKALCSRLGFCYATTALSEEQTAQYVQFRWQQTGVASAPFDDAALTLLHQAADGIPRTINQIGALATVLAATSEHSLITRDHVQHAVTQLPWLTAPHAIGN